MQEPRNALEEAIRRAVNELAPGATTPAAVLERPKQAAHGDYATNAALSLSKSLRRNPREIAQALAATLEKALPALVERTEIAGPGFVNVFLKPAARHAVIGRVLAEGADFGRGRSLTGRRIMVEFVSANPTGPLHVGHGRQAALGDAIANLLAAQGAELLREF